MNIKPLKDYILIKPIEEEAKTDSGLYLEETKQTLATVISIGSKVKDIKVNDKVFYRAYSLAQIEDLFLIKEEDVLAIIKD